MSLTLLVTIVWVHAIYRQSPLHEHAARLVDTALRVRGRYCIAPQNIIEFVAVVTRSRFVDPPLNSAEAGRIAVELY